MQPPAPCSHRGGIRLLPGALWVSGRGGWLLDSETGPRRGGCSLAYAIVGEPALAGTASSPGWHSGHDLLPFRSFDALLVTLGAAEAAQGSNLALTVLLPMAWGGLLLGLSSWRFSVIDL